jgi:hypothetical protein
MKQRIESSLITELQNLLAKGNVETVIETLRKEFGNDETILALSENWSRIKKERMLLLVSTNEINQRMSQLVYALIQYLEQLKQKPITGNRRILVEKPSPLEKGQNTSIWDWFFQNFVGGKLFIEAVALGGGILSVGALALGCISGAVERLYFNAFTWMSYLIHVLICFYAYQKIEHIKPNAIFLSNIGVIMSRKSEIDDSNKIIDDFKICWKWAWAGWGFLYMILIFSKARADNLEWLKPYLFNEEHKYVIDSVVLLLKNFFRDVTTLSIGACFSILYISKSNDSERHWSNNFTRFLSLVLLVVFMSQILSYIGHGFEFDNKLDETRDSYFQAITLLLFSVCLSLLISRFEGRLINTPILFPMLFYVYAGTQIANAFITEKSYPNFVAFTYSYSLFAKALLFLFVMWLIESGTLSLYVIRLRRIIGGFEEK